MVYTWEREGRLFCGACDNGEAAGLPCPFHQPRRLNLSRRTIVLAKVESNV